MAVEENMFNVSLDEEMQDVFYFQQITQEKEKLLFKVPWGGAIIRNSLENGEVIKFRTVKEYETFKKENNKQLWLLLPLKVFRKDNALFGVYCCPQCQTMSGTDHLSVDQDPRQILSRLCVHSKVCSTILGDWRNIWDIDLSPQDQVVKIVCNENIPFYTFQKQTKESTLLAAIRNSGEVALLYTVTSRQDTPICSICVTRKCPHVHSFKRQTEEAEEVLFASCVNGNEQPMEASTEQQESSDQADSMSELSECGSDQSDIEPEAGQNAERGKHKNYWVRIVIKHHSMYFGVIEYIS